MDHRLERQARNEALVREVNERIESLDKNATGWGDHDPFDFLCECGREGGCGTTVSLTIAEYEQVRAQDDRFALTPGHETVALENVIERSDRYVIVDKVADAEESVQDDPRGAPSH